LYSGPQYKQKKPCLEANDSRRKDIFGKERLHQTNKYACESRRQTGRILETQPLNPVSNLGNSETRNPALESKLSRLVSVLQGAKKRAKSNSGEALWVEKDRRVKESEGGDSKQRFPLLEDDIRHDVYVLQSAQSFWAKMPISG
jgi:hypothetical protein